MTKFLSHFGLMLLLFNSTPPQCLGENSLKNAYLLCHSLDSLIVDYAFSGTVKTESNQPVPNATISIFKNDVLLATVLTDKEGKYNYPLTPDTTAFYTIKAEKNSQDDIYVGISTFDIARISKHILGTDPFKSPYQFIAADVDKNREIDVIDLLNIRLLILRKKPLLPNGVWQFIDKNHIFKNNTNPLSENYPNSIIIKPNTQRENLDFVAIKNGDVNNTYMR